MIRPEQVWQRESEAAVAEQQEASPDAVMTRIGQAVILLHAGDREEARNRLGEIWSEIGEEGTPSTGAPWPTTWPTPRTIRPTSWPGTCGP